MGCLNLGRIIIILSSYSRSSLARQKRKEPLESRSARENKFSYYYFPSCANALHLNYWHTNWRKEIYVAEF